MKIFKSWLTCSGARMFTSITSSYAARVPGPGSLGTRLSKMAKGKANVNGWVKGYVKGYVKGDINPVAIKALTR